MTDKYREMAEDQENHACVRCGAETSGSYSEGGILWRGLCEQCMDAEREQDDARPCFRRSMLYWDWCGCPRCTPHRARQEEQEDA